MLIKKIIQKIFLITIFIVGFCIFFKLILKVDIWNIFFKPIGIEIINQIKRLFI